MKHSEYQVPVKIAYIGGGSLNWALNLMADLAADNRLAATVRLYDIDFAAAERNARIGARFAEVSKGSAASYQAVRRIEDALSGADIVVVSILPGSFDDMAKDIDIPKAYGVFQAVGDTVGPGGFVRAMRAIPMMLDIGAAIRAHAPEAYVCNLTNPMSVLTGALHKAHPGIRCWGECHEVTKLRKQVAWIANREAGEPVWTHRDVEVNVLGINHFTFVDRISLAGRDMMPAYRAFAEQHAEQGWTEREIDPADEHARYFEDRSRVKFDLLKRFGIAAAAGDRHLAEFLPVSEYLDDHASWAFGLTPVDYRIRYQAAKRARAEAIAAGSSRPQPSRSDEALVDQIHALMGGGHHVSNVNLPNRGQLDGFAAGTIVETNALFSGLGIRPLMSGSLPEELRRIVADHAARQDLLLTAVIERDRDALFPLFRTDPLVRALPDQAAREMFRAMVTATADRLPHELASEAA